MSEISDHGQKRMRKRLGLNKKAIEKEFARAILDGKKPAEFSGRFRKYLDFWCRDYQSQALVHGNAIYFHDHGTLITVWTVPSRYKKYLKEAADKQG